jgi:hypothetical protein
MDTNTSAASTTATTTSTATRAADAPSPEVLAQQFRAKAAAFVCEGKSTSCDEIHPAILGAKMPREALAIFRDYLHSHVGWRLRGGRIGQMRKLAEDFEALLRQPDNQYLEFPKMLSFSPYGQLTKEVADYKAAGAGSAAPRDFDVENNLHRVTLTPGEIEYLRQAGGKAETIMAFAAGSELPADADAGAGAALPPGVGIHIRVSQIGAFFEGAEVQADSEGEAAAAVADEAHSGADATAAAPRVYPYVNSRGEVVVPDTLPAERAGVVAPASVAAVPSAPPAPEAAAAGASPVAVANLIQFGVTQVVRVEPVAQIDDEVSDADMQARLDALRPYADEMDAESAAVGESPQMLAGQ